MKPLDLLVLSAIAVVVCYPLLVGAWSWTVRALKYGSFPPASPAPQAASPQKWQQRWTNTLIELLSDLERDNKTNAADICRELMWEIIGGTSTQVKK